MSATTTSRRGATSPRPAIPYRMSGGAPGGSGAGPITGRAGTTNPPSDSDPGVQPHPGVHIPT